MAQNMFDGSQHIATIEMLVNNSVLEAYGISYSPAREIAMSDHRQ